MDNLGSTDAAVNVKPRRPYATVNAVWPATIPPLTEQEAAAAARRLYRIAVDAPFKGRIKFVTGRRHTRFVYGTLNINVKRGWHSLVHTISHRAHRRLNPGRKPHDFRHAFIEKTLIAAVVSRGWLDGKLKRPEKPKPAVDQRQLRYQRVLARIAAWQKKAKRADTALKKLSRQKAYYERPKS